VSAWEYTSTPICASKAELNALGLEGWILCCAHPPVFWMRRPLPPAGTLSAEQVAEGEAKARAKEKGR
jgi:hypothetical protein